MTVHFPAVPDLIACLQRLIAQVPPGRVTTCGDLADALGNKIAARWVGHFSLHHEHADDCPCHRIVRAGGSLGGYVTGDSEEKVQRLRAEGIQVCDGTVDLDRFVFREFVTDRPLESLAQEQENIRSQIELTSGRKIPELTGGVDVAYPNAGEGQAAYALIETATGCLVWSKTVRRRVAFPYISSYLSFREIPILLELLDEVRAAGQLADVVLVDGTGILHPRRSGIASHLGVAASLATVGVTKKLLCGQVNIEGMTPHESRPVVHQGETIGVAIRPSGEKGTGPICAKHPPGRSGKLDQSPFLRPIFVSPGHLVDLAFCEELARRLLLGRRLPEPIYWADRLSKGLKVP